MGNTGKAFVDHWGWAAEKGLMNPHTASAIRAACAQILAVQDGWESLDVEGLDIEESIRRFENLRRTDFKPQSLRTYGARFRKAHADYIEFLRNPSAWRGIAGRSSRRPIKPGHGEQARDNERTEPATDYGAPSATLIDYPFPIRKDLIAHVRLPCDVKKAEIRRLSAFIATLAVDLDTDRTGSDG